MTLSTHVRVLDGTAVRPLFDHGRSLLGCTEANPWKRVDDRRGNPAIMNNIGQGLPSMLIVTYGPDGPLIESCNCDDPIEDDWRCVYCLSGPAFIVIKFDTGYGYRENGAGCSDLHAWLVREMGAWLTARGLRWMWHDEFNGTWHDGTEGLDEFGDADLGNLGTRTAA